MANSFLVIIYLIDAISMICAISTTFKLYMSGKNNIIAVLMAAMALSELFIFSSVFWINDLNKMPKAFCYFQALGVSCLWLNLGYLFKNILFIHVFLLTLRSYKYSFNMLYIYKL